MAEDQSLRERIREQIQAVDAASLVPHHQRGALLIVTPETAMLDVALAVAEDDVDQITARIDGGAVYKPSLGQLADWCVDLRLRLQFVVVQPYVLAQPLPTTEPSCANPGEAPSRT